MENLERIEEGLIKGAVDAISIEKFEKLLIQMKKCICKIKGRIVNGKQLEGTGFFCKIDYEYELIPVLITNFHVIDDDYMKNKSEIIIYINGDLKKINIDEKSKIYSSVKEEYDIMIIKLNEEDEIRDFLEIDQNIFKDDSTTSYEQQSIYILHYPGRSNISISFGCGIEHSNKFDIKHLCNTEGGSSGGPIINLTTNKVIGIHKGAINDKDKKTIYNIGTYMKYPLDELNKNEIRGNQIRMKLKINGNDIKKEIYFLDNTNGEKDSKCNKHYHDNLKELDETNTELFKKKKKKEYTKYFLPEREGIYTIELKFNIDIKDCSYMFFNCKNIISIDLFTINVTNITNMKYIFYGCSSLQNLKVISRWDTSNVVNMEGMFYGCNSLNPFPNIEDWNTRNVINMKEIFAQCNSLEYLPDISNWDTRNVENIDSIFCGCSSLKSLPDISKWNTENITNMKKLFYECKSLNSLPDISNWKTENVINMGRLFYGCISLKFLPDISRWNTKNVNDMSSMFTECKSISYFPDISDWDTKNLKDISYIFSKIDSLERLPDISKWDTRNVTNMEGLLSGCSSLKSLPNIDKWDTRNVTSIREIFFGCKALESLPDISKWVTKNVNNMNSFFGNAIL